MFKKKISSDSNCPLKSLSSGPEGPSTDSLLTQPLGIKLTAQTRPLTRGYGGQTSQIVPINIHKLWKNTILLNFLNSEDQRCVCLKWYLISHFASYRDCAELLVVHGVAQTYEGITYCMSTRLSYIQYIQCVQHIANQCIFWLF